MYDEPVGKFLVVSMAFFCISFLVWAYLTTRTEGRHREPTATLEDLFPQEEREER